MEASGLGNIARFHARLRHAAADLFRALDERDRARVEGSFARFLDEVDRHLDRDLTVGFRLLTRHRSEAVRRIAERVFEEQQGFPIRFHAFAGRWRHAALETLMGTACRDELESLVTDLFKRLNAEERLATLLAQVA